MIRKIQLYGQLGKRYGRTHRMDVASPAEAIRALDANYPGFMEEILALGRKGYGYRVAHGVRGTVGVNNPEELCQPAGGDIRITPVLKGSKKGGIGQILAAVALIVASFYVPGLAGTFGMSGATAASVASSMMSAGIAMAIGGVIQLLSPQPKAAERGGTEGTSYVFDGATNTMAQGHPVPVGYGEMIVGSAVISAGIEVDQVKISNPEAEAPTWTNPVTGLTEPYPAPTLAWDENLNNWTLPDGTQLIYDTDGALTYGNDGSATYNDTKLNFRTADGRVPTLTAETARWDIPSPTSFAVYSEKLSSQGIFGAATTAGQLGAWLIRNGTVAIYFNEVEKRWFVPRTNNYGTSAGPSDTGA